jgi:purine-nucleoside phosphorylase
MLANAAGLRVAGLSCITNLAAGISPTPLTHEEVTAATCEAMPRMTAVIANFWKELAREKI